MLAFQTAPNINIIDTSKLCPCCKDDLCENGSDYIKISCGHEYHYDCILDAFEYNKKRSTNVLECPYCRAKVNPLPHKEGYDYCSSIHGGMTYVMGVSDKWSNKHKGVANCCFKNKKNLYCNGTVSLNNKYCWQHLNVEHLGSGYCQFKKGDNYCNHNSLSNYNYCYLHKQYQNAQHCVYIFASGCNKGSKCDKWCFPNAEEPAQYCLSHMKHKDKPKKEDKPKVICQEILKSGAKKGQICGATNCKRHVANNVVINKGDNTSENSSKIISLVNVVEPPIIVHVEKSLAEKNNGKFDDIFKMELTELLWNLFGKVSAKEQSSIEHFIAKYNLEK